MKQNIENFDYVKEEEKIFLEINKRAFEHDTENVDQDLFGNDDILLMILKLKVKEAKIYISSDAEYIKENHLNLSDDELKQTLKERKEDFSYWTKKLEKLNKIIQLLKEPIETEED